MNIFFGKFVVVFDLYVVDLFEFVCSGWQVVGVVYFL